jgi:hypothetical protein
MRPPLLPVALQMPHILSVIGGGDFLSLLADSVAAYVMMQFDTLSVFGTLYSVGLNGAERITNDHKSSF